MLRAQLEVAAESGLNVILHNRESWDDLVAQVMPFSSRLRGVFHCFTGSLEQAGVGCCKHHLTLAAPQCQRGAFGQAT